MIYLDVFVVVLLCFISVSKIYLGISGLCGYFWFMWLFLVYVIISDLRGYL